MCGDANGDRRNDFREKNGKLLNESLRSGEVLVHSWVDSSQP